MDGIRCTYWIWRGRQQQCHPPGQPPPVHTREGHNYTTHREIFASLYLVLTLSQLIAVLWLKLLGWSLLLLYKRDTLSSIHNHVIIIILSTHPGSGEVGNSIVILQLSHLLYTPEKATITLLTERFLPAYLVPISPLFAVLWL